MIFPAFNGKQKFITMVTTASTLFIYILKIKFKVLQETGYDTNKMRVNKTEVQCTSMMLITCEIIHGRKGPQ
jgi:hypothetical protein